MGPGGKYLTEWRQYGEFMLGKALLTLTSNTEGLQARSAAAVVFSIARSSLICCNAVTERLMPVLLAKCADTCSCLQGSVFKAYLSASPTANNGVVNSAMVPSISLQMMKQLLRCIGPCSGHDTSHYDTSLDNDADEEVLQVDFSSLGVLNPLR
jgi:hypothetical protein